MSPHPDPFRLERFVDAQRHIYVTVVSELRAGRKRSHWMWFIFPQIAGLGESALSQRYAIASLDEARAYVAHPVLGPRLRECAALVVGIEGRSIGEILGDPDDRKLHSSMTLFAQAAPDEPIFTECLRRYFGGEEDPETPARL